MSPEQMETVVDVGKAHKELRAKIAELAQEQRQARLEKRNKNPYTAARITAHLRVLIVLRRGRKALYNQEVDFEPSLEDLFRNKLGRGFEVHALPPEDHGLFGVAVGTMRRIIETYGITEESSAPLTPEG